MSDDICPCGHPDADHDDDGECSGCEDEHVLHASCDFVQRTISTQRATIADLRARLDTAERELAGARGHAIEAAAHRNVALDRADTAERKRDEYLAACQQKHGVHPDWVTRATESAATIADLAASLEAAESYADATIGAHHETILRCIASTQAQRESLVQALAKLAHVRKLMNLPLSVHRGDMIDRVLAILNEKDVT